MVASCLATAESPGDLRIHLAVDADDACAGDYEALVHACSPLMLHVNREPRGVPALMDWLAKRVDADILMAASDDIVFCSRAWDARVIEAFEAVPDRVLLAYTNDGRGRDKVEHFFVSREWVNAVGWFMWPEFEHFFGDEWNEHIGRALGRLVFLRDVVTEHRHCKYGQSENDETYRMKRRPAADGTGMTDRDASRMRALMPEVARIAARIQAGFSA